MSFLMFYSQSQSRQEQNCKHNQLRTENEVNCYVDRKDADEKKTVDYCVRKKNDCSKRYKKISLRART